MLGVSIYRRRKKSKRGGGRLWYGLMVQFDLAVCVVVGVSSIAAGDCLYVWMYIDGL